MPASNKMFYGILALLAAEIAGLNLCYSTMYFGSKETLWERMLYYSTWFMAPMVLSIVAAILFLKRKSLGIELRRARNNVRPWKDAWPFLCLHLGLFAAFALLTDFVIGGAVHSTGYPLIWVGLWALTGVAALGSWGLIFLPAHVWSEMARRTVAGVGKGLAIACVVGIVALVGTRLIWTTPTKATFWAVQELMSPFFPDMLYDPNALTLGTPDFSIVIAPICSGIEGMGIIAAFLAFCFWQFRHLYRFPQALLLLPIGIAAMWLTNVFRLVALITIGTTLSAEVALGGFHTKAGWIAFNAVAFGLVAVAGKMEFFTRIASVPKESIQTNPTAAYLAPLLAVVGAAMVTGAFTAQFDWLYPLRVLAAVVVLWFFRNSYGEVKWSWSWEAIALGAGTGLMWLALAHEGPASQADPPEILASVPVGWAGIWVLFKVAGYVVTVPIAEELAFRGYLLRRLISAEFLKVTSSRISWFPLIFSSALFGTMHGSNWLPGTLAGMLFALALYRRGQVADAVQAHATANALLATYVLVTGDWSKWS